MTNDPFRPLRNKVLEYEGLTHKYPDVDWFVNIYAILAVALNECEREASQDD